MKRFIGAALSAALALTLAVPAAAEENKVGDVVGHTYYTDITAQIDGHPLPSYNIGGETAVVAEDLREYGFSVVWDGEARTLTVERDLEGRSPEITSPRGRPRLWGPRLGTSTTPISRPMSRGRRWRVLHSTARPLSASLS